MSADQAFLDSLKPGDKFVLRTRRLTTFGSASGPEVYEVVRIPPKRGKFVVKGPEGRDFSHEFEIKGHGTYITGGGFSKDYFTMEPFTDKVDAEMKAHDDLIRAKNRAYKLQVLLKTFEDKANDLTPAQIDDFTDASMGLNAFLAQFDKLKGAD